MSLSIRAMRAEEADQVAEMVRGLARHIGTDVVPKLTGEGLRNAADLIDVVWRRKAAASLAPASVS